MEGVIKLRPTIKSYVWGGHFFQKYGKGNTIISELWELSARGPDSSIVVSGFYKGQRLDQVVSSEDIGPVAKKNPKIPLLIKLIDAEDNLSVQVHPDDKYAKKYEYSLGKMEMWHVISADMGAGIYVGLTQKSSRKEIKQALENGTILSYLNFFEVSPGDTFVIKPGTIHAIGKGVRLIEIQENSDITYRLYDYNRLGLDGKPRQLHIEKGLDVIDYSKYTPEQNKEGVLADNKYFKVQRIDINGSLLLHANGKSFMSFTFISGKGYVNDMKYDVFDTFFLPYGKECLIKGTGTIILSEAQ